MITKEIGEMIVKEASTVLDLNVNIMNDKGVIVASGDPSRLNLIHEGALEVLRTQKPLKITKDNKKGLKGTLAGTNLPITFQNEIIGVIGITGNPKEIGNRGELVQMLTNLFVNQAFIISQAEWRQRTKEMIIEDLLMENQNKERIDRRLSLLDIDFKPPFVVSVIEINDTPLSRTSLITIIDNVFEKKKVLTGFIHFNKLIIITNEVDYDDVTLYLSEIVKKFEKQKIDMRLSYSSAIKEIQLIPYGYYECDIAMEISQPHIKIVSYIDVEPKALVYQIDSKLTEQFCDRILQKNIKNHIETLQTFFDCNFNLKETADKLYVHRNTLIYRLKKIREESGYDPQNFQDAFAIQLAIWMYKKNNGNVE